MATAVAAAADLPARWRAIECRLDAAEAAASLYCRFAAIMARLEIVERALREAGTSGAQAPGSAGTVAGTAAAAAQAAAEAAASRQAAFTAATGPDASPIQLRLAQELFDKGFSDFRFVRVPPHYYDEPLEWRRDCLAAASTDHLCKSIIMENTRAHESMSTPSPDPSKSKYFVVVVQYTARLNADKLKAHVHRLAGGRLGKQHFNMRLCPEDVSDALSGYEHNAVSPIGLATPLPIILSHRVAALHPDVFFLGAGEVDLKVGLSAAAFVEAYQPLVLDCTY